VHMTSSPVDWYAARAAGVVAYVLLSLTVTFGLTMAGKKQLRRWPRFAVEDVHRFGGILVGTFVTIHVVTIAIDSWLPFSIGSLIVPFTSRYKPIWVGLGIVAAELLLALAVTNRLRNRKFSYRFWRRAHYLNFVVWGAATVHNLGSGTDRSTPWLIAIDVVAIGLVGGATAARALARRLPRVPLLGASGAIAVALGVVAVLLVTGPFRFHPKPWNAATFRDSLTGQVQQQLAVTRGIVSFAGQGKGDQRVLVRADLLIEPRALLATSFQMEYLPSGLMCSGKVTKTHPFGFSARCRTEAGTSRLVTATWQLGPQNLLASGTLDVKEIGGPAPTRAALG
jgi:methionine sulfoxide reductase heme-binding subunit